MPLPGGEAFSGQGLGASEVWGTLPEDPKAEIPVGPFPTELLRDPAQSLRRDLINALQPDSKRVLAGDRVYVG